MTTSHSKTIDCQVHCYERNQPERTPTATQQARWEAVH